MPISDGNLVSGDISLESVCEFYHPLKKFEEESVPAIEGKYNKARKEVKELIIFADISGLREYGFIDELIDKLEEKYFLK